MTLEQYQKCKRIVELAGDEGRWLVASFAIQGKQLVVGIEWNDWPQEAINAAARGLVDTFEKTVTESKSPGGVVLPNGMRLWMPGGD